MMTEQFDYPTEEMAEMTQVMETFIVQEDWDNINRYIHDLKDRGDKTPAEANREAMCVFEGLKDAVANTEADKDMVMSKLDTESVFLLKQWNAYMSYIANPPKMPASLDELIDMIAGKAAPPQDHKPVYEDCIVCPSKDSCDLFSEAFGSATAPHSVLIQ